ncbi:MAG: Ig-like domain-containing protein [Prevotellaceae bacterium]|jgi:uncharacterized protein YjdB|nr:Ig-like domain-containing protein [Prevotellaceae bacterium]
MKKIHYLLTLAACIAITITLSCGEEDTPGYTPEVINNPVTGITITNATADGIVLPDVGATAQVQVSATPANAGDADRYHYSYLSGDQRIFTVSPDGIVTATGAGGAWLTVVPNNNAALATRCKVTVVGIRVTAIEIAPGYETWTMTRTNAAGPTFDLAAQLTIVPADASIRTLRYSSSDPSVATVNEDGLVTALWEGETVIRIEATDHSGVYAESVVTVAITPVATITFNTPTATTTYYQFSLNDRDNRDYSHAGPSAEAQLTNRDSPMTKGTTTSSHVRYQPSNATLNTLEYESLNPSILNVETTSDNRLILTPVAGVGGTATIRASATDGHGAYADQVFKVHHMLDQTAWKVIDASAYGTKTGSGTGDTEVAYWDIEEALHGGVGTLLKPAAPLPPADVAGTPLTVRTDSAYFVIDMQAQTKFDYFSVQWNRSMETGSRVRYFSLHGSNDNINYTFLTRIDKASNWQYRTVLSQAYTYRYLKIKVINASSYNYTGGSGNAGITYWHICNLNLGVLP